MKIIIELTPTQTQKLKRPINGTGGWQSLLKHLGKKLSNGNLELTIADVARILRYSDKYGDGGFQDRLEGPVKQTRQLAASILKALDIKTSGDMGTLLMANQSSVAGRSKAAPKQPAAKALKDGS